MYKLESVTDKEGFEVADKSHIVGKDFFPTDVKVGERATLENITDSHIYRRVEKTSIVSSIVDSLREMKVFTKDFIYVLKKI